MANQLTTVSELCNTLKIIVNLYGSLYLIDEKYYMKLKYPIFALFCLKLHLVLVHILLCSLDMILYPYLLRATRSHTPILLGDT